MSWQNLRLGAKMAISFGLLLVLIVVQSFQSASGVEGIIAEGTRVLRASQLKGEINQRIIDHLRWATKAGAFMSDGRRRRPCGGRG